MNIVELIKILDINGNILLEFSFLFQIVFQLLNEECKQDSFFFYSCVALTNNFTCRRVHCCGN